MTSEDEGYRHSSQYRHWSFTHATLDEIRENTNAFAVEKLERVIAGSKIQPLSAEEELLIVEKCSEKIIQIGENMEPRVPSSIIATAIQYLRRFYLTNSTMIYHPRQITACALFLAMKADHFYKSLSDFVANLDNVTEGDVKASEFRLVQALRFTLDVQHPMRGLEGGIMHIQAIVGENCLGDLQRQYQGRLQSSSQRVADAANHAKSYLRSAAQMTDAYFLYTPSQIWLAALSAADNELVDRYLKHIFSRQGVTDANTLFDKIVSTVDACAELLRSYQSVNDDDGKEKEMKKAVRKLKSLQKVEEFNTLATLQTQAGPSEKRVGSLSEVTEKIVKKRRLEREGLEKGGEVFGPNLR